jgi:hypothetical protein
MKEKPHSSYLILVVVLLLLFNNIVQQLLPALIQVLAPFIAFGPLNPVVFPEKIEADENRDESNRYKDIIGDGALRLKKPNREYHYQQDQGINKQPLPSS